MQTHASDFHHEIYLLPVTRHNPKRKTQHLLMITSVGQVLINNGSTPVAMLAMIRSCKQQQGVLVVFLKRSTK